MLDHRIFEQFRDGEFVQSPAKSIGIMQGRLLPPQGDRIQCFPATAWRSEFELAAQAKLTCIEWIYELHGSDVNPLATDVGIEEIKALSDQHGVFVESLCADYFMDMPLVRTSAADREMRLETLRWLISRCSKCGISRIVIPFVDVSKIDNSTDWRDVVTSLRQVLPDAEQHNIELHLETSLAPPEFGRLLDELAHPLLWANYDSGNSASLGFNPREEFATYGSRIGSVHIKDRLLGGGTVPLGTGHADLAALFECLHGIAYSGPFVLQVARGSPGDELAWARRNREFVLAQLEQTR